ncbi:EAL domain-containing response regulator [Pseudomarimonas salicorniae]|uniref:EAL domain-containing response regulator n=1 Tax=Pseudomarimonas salicorniae TaxID=2933270 RepID=A0ABT0GGS5_9GAMM|nr:EAL domain-containing response regulator [Lysobacter sp. CAU 1642]MCK7593414.1 EAL domain-containing response regulator [Lysobacter sp. CAU 1642]
MTAADVSIMVVEDHGFQRRMALRLLAELGVTRTLEAAHGEQALQVLKEHGSAPDILLVDLDLPGMDGIEFISQVAQQRLAQAVALVSALDQALISSVQGMARAYGLRVIGAVEKPLTASKLAHLIERFEQPEAGDEPVEGEELDAAAIRAAIAERRIEPFFQPQVTFTNGQLISVEALARLRGEDGEIVCPNRFIGVAEREGLIDAITEAVLVQACEWKRRWVREGLHSKVAVNMSMRNLGRVDAADRYLGIVRDCGVDPREVVLELTESSVMEEAASSLHVLARLRLKGFGLSIDDFGTGYSSLSQLSQIPFTELKVDRSLVSGSPRHPRKRAVIEASLDLARKLNLGVVAEGVETVDEWQMLAELGCTYAQGYLIGKPTAGAELPDAIARWRRPER